MFSVCVCYCWVMRRLMCSASEQFADGCSALCWGGTNTVKSISPLPRSAALNEVAMSSSLTYNMPHLFSPNILSFVRDELQCLYRIIMCFLNSSYYLCDVINVTLSSCLIASVLHECVMASAQHQDLNSVRMRFSRFMTCHWKGAIVYVKMCNARVCMGACPHMPMNINDGSCEIMQNEHLGIQIFYHLFLARRFH